MAIASGLIMDSSSHMPFTFEPEAYHDGSRGGYFVLVTRGDSGERKEGSYALSALSDALETVSWKTDSWISAAEFFERGAPLAANAARVALAWVVLDYQKVRKFAGIGPEKAADLVIEHCKARGIPEPSLIVACGGKLELKWVLCRPAPSSAFSRWRAVQRELCKKFDGFRPDHAARDVTTVFRMVGSVETSTGSIAKVVHCARTASAKPAAMCKGLVVYDFDGFAASVLPYTRDEVKEYKRRKAAVRNSRRALRAKTSRDLMAARLHDLRTLMALRGLDRPAAPVPQRELVAFLGAAFLGQLVAPDELSERIAIFVHELKLEWRRDEIEGRLNAVLERDVGASAENGTPGHYKLENEAVIAMLGITDDEQRELSTLIDKQEVARRHKERQAALRRKNGLKTREETRKIASERRQQARAMRAAGKKWGEIQTALGYPSPDAARADCSRT